MIGQSSFSSVKVHVYYMLDRVVVDDFIDYFLLNKG